MIKEYLSYYYENFMPQEIKQNFETDDAYISEHYDLFRKQVLDCGLLNNFFWGVWALALLSEEECCKTGIFNYDFADARC